MTTTTIVVALAAILIIAIGIIVTTQLREKARIEKARKMRVLENSYQLTQSLLDGLPPQYLTDDLQKIILRRAEDVCRKLASLKTGLPVTKWQSQIGARRQAIADDADKGAVVRIESPGQAGEIKQLLQSLFRMIETMQRGGLLESQLARKNLKLTLYLINKTSADLHVHDARELARNNEIRKAINAYHLASTEMGKSPNNPAVAKAIKSYRTRIQELENQLHAPADQPVSQEKSRLDKEWDNFLEEDDWKKKVDYD